jgi:hypothetical protein
MVITSMNLYEFSEKNNRETGVLVTSAEEVYASAVTEVQSILAAAEPQSLAGRGYVGSRNVPARGRSRRRVPTVPVPAAMRSASAARGPSGMTLSYRTATGAPKSGGPSRTRTTSSGCVTRAVGRRDRA